VLGLLGRDGGAMLPLCDQALVVPCQETYLIQEVTMLVGHLLCDLMEQALFGDR
jgi:D-sedoheptulose 7-phosphate isomerase